LTYFWCEQSVIERARVHRWVISVRHLPVFCRRNNS